MGDRTRTTGILKLFFMFALTSLVLWMLYGIVITIGLALSPSTFSTDIFGGIASGLVIGLFAGLTNGIIAAGYVVARGLIKNDRSFSVPERNALYYVAAIGMNITIFAAMYGVSK